MSATFGIDARAAAEVSAGRGRVVREVLRALSAADGTERYVLYCREPASLDLDGRFEWRRVRLPDPAWHVDVARRASRECDAFLSTNSYLTAWFVRCPCAVIVYDLVAFRPDGHAQRRAARIERATIDVGVRRAAALVCISEATRNDLVARVPSAGPRAIVVPLAAGPGFDAAMSTATAADAAARHGIDGPYVLATGTLEPRKNLGRLIDAWEQLPGELRTGRELVLVGPTGWEAEDVVARARAGAVRALGHVPDTDLAALYVGCDVFCFPSLYEGFGLPVLEAMAAGAPVITSDVSSMPEVAGDAALLVDPHSTEAIRDALVRLLGDPFLRDELRAAGHARAAQFSWERTAVELRAVLGSIQRRSVTSL